MSESRRCHVLVWNDRVVWLQLDSTNALCLEFTALGAPGELSPPYLPGRIYNVGQALLYNNMKRSHLRLPLENERSV